ncbi:MAG: hypothetical protein ACOX60_12150 [Massiliimalia sp.]|jgi:hypothetical protein
MAHQSLSDQERFLMSCQKVISLDYERNSIGLLKEKTLHAVLKDYFDPHPENQEVKLGGYVADIVGENGVVEIQTSNFGNLRKKLPAFLEVCPVTVVYPVDRIKWLCWIDPETGAVSKRRRSPKKGNLYDGFREFYQIRQWLLHPNLTVRVLFLETEEYRYLNGWSRDKKRGSVRCDRIPLGLLEEVSLCSVQDYLSWLPETLPDQFTVKDLAKGAGISDRCAQWVISVYKSAGLIVQIGKRGKAYLYTVNGKNDVL